MEKITLNLAGKDDFFTQEAYKVLRTNLQFSGHDIKTILITSCKENEGKTTVTLNLGVSIAELGKKVLVIDADMRKSVMAGRNTDVKKAIGLSEILTGQNHAKECIYGTQYPGLNIIFAGKYPPNPVELLSSDFFNSLLKVVKEHYDYILIDSPPLGEVVDAAVIAPKTDGVVIVMGDENVRRRQARDVIDQIRKSDSKILGVVRNNSKKSGHSYYYGKKYKLYPLSRTVLVFS